MGLAHVEAAVAAACAQANENQAETGVAQKDSTKRVGAGHCKGSPFPKDLLLSPAGLGVSFGFYAGGLEEKQNRKRPPYPRIRACLKL
jgi:hypothetical protein